MCAALSKIEVGRRDCALPNQKLVFVVDDDPSILRGLRRLLTKYGYESQLFESAEAFESCDDFKQGICVVLDIQLNGVSGIELRHRLINAGVSLPVIYITANDSESIRAAAVRSGCIAYLTKPFPAKALIEPIARVAAGQA
jgi:FixJ family two-component response regulator